METEAGKGRAQLERFFSTGIYGKEGGREKTNSDMHCNSRKRRWLRAREN